jgi:Na+-transporting methylmalonyl-CoA/oxaloacetate decarboxylase beta subunit
MLLVKKTPPLLLFFSVSWLIDLSQLPFMPSRMRMPAMIEIGVTAFLLIAIILWIIFGSKSEKTEEQAETE